MFTVEQRDALRERILRLAGGDDRVVAGAAVGSLAVGGGDRFSDLNLAFGIADRVPVTEVLGAWMAALVDELGAVQLANLQQGPTIYRVFLLPEALQFDLSMTPAAQFRPAGPRFRLLFGKTTAGQSAVPTPKGGLFIPTPPVARDVFGWGVIYALHARACIERRRLWQAEHYVGAVRDHALSLACLRHGLAAVQAVAMTICPLRSLLDSTTPTSAGSNLRRFGQPSPRPSRRSYRRARTRPFPLSVSSRSDLLSSADVIV